MFDRQGIDSGFATFDVTCDQGCLPNGIQLTLSGSEITDANKAGINSALSQVTNDKTPLIAYDIQFETSQGDEWAPLTDLMVSMQLQSLIFPSYESYALVYRDRANAYQRVNDYKIVDISNQNLVYTDDLVGTYYLVGIGNKQS